MQARSVDKHHIIIEARITFEPGNRYICVMLQLTNKTATVLYLFFITTLIILYF